MGVGEYISKNRKNNCHYLEFSDKYRFLVFFLLEFSNNYRLLVLLVYLLLIIFSGVLVEIRAERQFTQRRVAALSPSARKELMERKRAAQLKRILLPTPLRKRGTRSVYILYHLIIVFCFNNNIPAVTY